MNGGHAAASHQACLGFFEGGDFGFGDRRRGIGIAGVEEGIRFAGGISAQLGEFGQDEYRGLRNLGG